MGTNVKINIFGTFPVKSANVNRKTIYNIFLTMTAFTNIIFISIIRTVGGHSFLTKTRNIHNTVFPFCTYHEIKFLSVFITNTAFVTSRY